MPSKFSVMRSTFYLKLLKLMWDKRGHEQTALFVRNELDKPRWTRILGQAGRRGLGTCMYKMRLFYPICNDPLWGCHRSILHDQDPYHKVCREVKEDDDAWLASLEHTPHGEAVLERIACSAYDLINIEVALKACATKRPFYY